MIASRTITKSEAKANQNRGSRVAVAPSVTVSCGHIFWGDECAGQKEHSRFGSLTFSYFF